MDYHTEAPPVIRDFLVYHETIQGHSRKTVDEYYLDLRSFFRFILREKHLVSPDTAFDEIPLDQVISLRPVYGAERLKTTYRQVTVIDPAARPTASIVWMLRCTRSVSRAP